MAAFFDDERLAQRLQAQQYWQHEQQQCPQCHLPQSQTSRIFQCRQCRQTSVWIPTWALWHPQHGRRLLIHTHLSSPLFHILFPHKGVTHG